MHKRYPSMLPNFTRERIRATNGIKWYQMADYVIYAQLA